MRRIIVNEEQFNKLSILIEGGINENNTVPTDLRNLLNDNLTATFISFVKSDGQKVNFKILNDHGHLRLTNITKKAIYYNFSGDFRPATTIYGTKAIINYDTKLVLNKDTNTYEEKNGTWKDTITNIIKVELFKIDGELLDSMEIDDVQVEPKIELPIDERVIKFNSDFKNLKSKQQFRLVAKQVYEGSVLDKRNSLIEFELVNTKNRNNVITGEFNSASGDVFKKSSEETILFDSIKYVKNKESYTKRPLVINDIKNFIVIPIPKTKDELEQEKAEEERKKKEQAELDAVEQKKKDDEERKNNSEKRKQEIEADKKLGKKVYDIIMNDDVLKKAFFHQPKFLGMIKAGNPIGIVPASKIVNSYLIKDTNKKIGENAKKFPVNSTITFKVVDKDMVIPDADNFTLPVGKTYKAIVRQREIGVNHIQLIHKKDEYDPEFFLNIYQQRDKNDIEHDIYPANIKIEYLSTGHQRYTYPPSEMGKIKVTNYKFR